MQAFIVCTRMTVVINYWVIFIQQQFEYDLMNMNIELNLKIDYSSIIDTSQPINRYIRQFLLPCSQNDGYIYVWFFWVYFLKVFCREK